MHGVLSLEDEWLDLPWSSRECCDAPRRPGRNNPPRFLRARCLYLAIAWDDQGVILVDLAPDSCLSQQNLKLELPSFVVLVAPAIPGLKIYNNKFLAGL